MDPEEEFSDAESRIWESAARAFLRPAPRPTISQNEIFTRQVMARIAAEEAAASAQPRLAWLIPALSVGLTAALLFVAGPGPGVLTASDTAYLAGEDMLSVLAAPRTTAAEDTLTMALEGK
jgi:hypothetical protein